MPVSGSGPVSSSIGNRYDGFEVTSFLTVSGSLVKASFTPAAPAAKALFLTPGINLNCVRSCSISEIGLFSLLLSEDPKAAGKTPVFKVFAADFFYGT